MLRVVCGVRSLLAIAMAVIFAAPQGQTLRSVYVMAAASDGSALLDVTAADLVLREGNQPRTIVRVEPSRAKLQVGIAVEEQLTPDNDLRRSVANFIDRIR